MKIQLLRRRREELGHGGMYSDESEDPDSLDELKDDEHEYLLSLLKRETIQEEDAELSSP